jgi:hypothetical protein
MRPILTAAALALLAGCTPTKDQVAQLQSFTVADIDHAYGWAVFNNDRPAMQCLPTLRYIVVKISADDPSTYGVVTWAQMAGDLANPASRINIDCAALKAERKAQVQQAIGGLLSFVASPGLAL